MPGKRNPFVDNLITCSLSLFEKFAEQIPRKTFNFNNLFWALELA